MQSKVLKGKTKPQKRMKDQSEMKGHFRKLQTSFQTLEVLKRYFSGSRDVNLLGKMSRLLEDHPAKASQHKFLKPFRKSGKHSRGKI